MEMKGGEGGMHGAQSMTAGGRQNGAGSARAQRAAGEKTLRLARARSAWVQGSGRKEGRWASRNCT